MSLAPTEQCMRSYEYIFRRDLLRGKVAFITGGGTGICFTIAETFMRHGCDVVIASRRLDKLEESARTLQYATSQECLPLQMDVRKPQDIERAVDCALSKFKRIDYLVNGAAGNFLCPVAGLSYNAFRTVMDIDAIGTFNVSKMLYGKWFKDHGGVIVNITATLHFRGSVLQAHAGSAKAAVEALTRHMAVEWGRDGIRVMCVAPGPISDTEGMRRLAPSDPAIMEELTQSIPVKRLGTREDIGNTVMYIVSNAAALLTGTTIVADGGSWLTSSNDYGRISKFAKL